jgi:hypothetical protein
MAQGDRHSPPGALDQRIDELEALLAAARRDKAAVDGSAIPILDDEVVPAGTAPEGPAAGPDTPTSAAAPESPDHGILDQRLTPRQLVELGQRLQQRMDSELEELTDVIRGVVKRCILEELRRELPQVGQAAARKPDPH